MLSRGAAVFVAVGAALTCAGLAGSTASFHNTEKHGLGGSFRPQVAGEAGGSFSATVVVVQGRPSVDLSWALRVGPFRGRVLEASLHQGHPGAGLRRVVRLCAPCGLEENGTIIVQTGRPWFPLRRSMAVIPSLTLQLRTTRRPRTSIEAVLVKKSFHAYFS